MLPLHLNVPPGRLPPGPRWPPALWRRHSRVLPRSVDQNSCFILMLLAGDLGEGWRHDLLPRTILTVFSEAPGLAAAQSATHAPPETPLGPGTGVGTSLRTTKQKPNPQLPPRAHLPPATQPEAPGEHGSSGAAAASKALSPAWAKHRPRVARGRPRTRRSRPGRCLRGRSGPVGPRLPSARRGDACWAPAAVPPAREASAEESPRLLPHPLSTSAPSLPSGHTPSMGFPCLLLQSCLSKP